MTAHSYKSNGQVLIIILLLTAVVVTTVTILFQALAFFNRASIRGYQDEQALQLAEAGLERALYELRQSDNYSGGNIFLGAGEIAISVANDRNPPTNSEKTVSAVSCIPSQTNCLKSKTVRLAVRQNADKPIYNFEYPAFAFEADNPGAFGYEGIVMDIFSNSKIIRSDSGDAAYSNATILCDDSIYASEITGNAYANAGITPNNNCISGTATPNASQKEMSPLLNIAELNDWKTKADLGTYYAGGQTWNTNRTEGPALVDGDLTINSNPTIKLQGPLHVKGNLTIFGPTIQPDYGYLQMDGKGTVIIVDKDIIVKEFSAAFQSNIDEKMMLIGQNEGSDENQYSIKIEDCSKVGYIYSIDHLVEIEKTSTGCISQPRPTAVAVTAKRITLKEGEISPESNQLGEIQFFKCVPSPDCTAFWVPILTTYKIQ